MKRYITRDYFLQDYGYEPFRDDKITDEKITYAIQVASTKIDTITGGAISKAIRTGFYLMSVGGTLTIAPGKITDPEQSAIANDALEAIKEQTASLTKFVLDTGWDFLSGSFSSNIGSQGQSETIDFETSLQSIEKSVREALAVYDFDTILYTGEIEVAFEDDDEDKWKDHSERPLTEEALVARLTGGFLKGNTGIKVSQTVPGVPSKGITISFDGATFELTNYPDKNDFQTKASDGGIGTYQKDGHPVFLIKFAGVAYEFLSADALALALNQIEANKQAIITINDAIAQLKKIGHYRGTYATLADAQTAIPAPNRGDIVHIGANAPYQEQIFNGAVWEAGGQVIHTISLQQVSDQQDPKIAKAKADAIKDADAKLANKADSFDKNRLMSTTATPDGVHIKRVGGYHSESSFAGGAFFGIAKDDYSVMAAFKFINDKANIRFRDAGGAMQDITLQKIYDIAQLKGKIDNLPNDTNSELNKKADKEHTYTKIESDKKFEPLTTDIAPTASHQAGFIILDEAGIINATIGTQLRLDLKGIDDMITNPANVPGAGDKLFVGIHGAIRILNSAGSASLKWETKTNATDINVKDNYKTKYFVVKKISATEYVFVRLEDKPTKPHWETIDQTTYTFTEPVKVRITYNAQGSDMVITGYGTFFKANNSLIFKKDIDYKEGYGSVYQLSFAVWNSNSSDKTKINHFIFSYSNPKAPYVMDIIKFEIWKEA